MLGKIIYVRNGMTHIIMLMILVEVVRPGLVRSRANQREVSCWQEHVLQSIKSSLLI